MSAVFKRREQPVKTETERMSCDDRGRHQSDVAASQRMSLGWPPPPPEAGKGQGRILPKVSEESWPCCHRISDFWPPEL